MTARFPKGFYFFTSSLRGVLMANHPDIMRPILKKGGELLGKSTARASRPFHLTNHSSFEGSRRSVIKSHRNVANGSLADTRHKVFDPTGPLRFINLPLLLFHCTCNRLCPVEALQELGGVRFCPRKCGRE